MTAGERNPYKRAWYWRRAAKLDHRRFVFLDESAVNIAMTPTYGRAQRGCRVVDSAPRNYGEQTSVIAALSLRRGLIAPMTMGGALDTLAFDAYLMRVLEPCLRKGDILVLDNLGVHKASRVELVCAERGASVLWLPPYSPDTLTDRAGVVEDQDCFARGKSAHPRRTRQSVSSCADAGNKGRHLRLVHALRLRGRIRVNAAVVIRMLASLVTRA